MKKNAFKIFQKKLWPVKFLGWENFRTTFFFIFTIDKMSENGKNHEKDEYEICIKI